MKGSGNSRASGIQFYSRIASLLENAAVRFTMTDCGLYCCVSAFRDSGYGHQDNGCGHEIRIVLIPLVARTPAEAVLQREEASSLAGQSYTVIVSEDRWMKSPEIISSRILANLGIFRGIFARDCEIRKITRPEADSFLARSHSYGGASSRYCYGVFLKRDRIRPHNAASRPGCSHTPGFTAGTGMQPYPRLYRRDRHPVQLTPAPHKARCHDSRGRILKRTPLDKGRAHSQIIRMDTLCVTPGRPHQRRHGQSAEPLHP